MQVMRVFFCGECVGVVRSHWVLRGCIYIIHTCIYMHMKNDDKPVVVSPAVDDVII